MQKMTHDQPRIVFVAGLILVLATIISGSIVFLLMERHAEGLLRKNLLSSLQSKVKTVEAEIRQRRAAAVTVATRPFLIDQVQQASAPGGGDEALRMLERGAKSFLSSGLSAIALNDADGHELARAGSFAQRPDLAVSLDPEGRTQILWKGSFLLRTSVDIVSEGRNIGRVIAEAPLPAISSLFQDSSLGKTSDLALCAPLGTDMQCFPTTLNPAVFPRIKQRQQDKVLPMSYALQGQTGFIVTRDYRHQKVVAAYSPVESLG